MPYTLVLSKENFKFSSSHFTLFSQDDAEHLHGHNYKVSLRASFGDVDKNTEMTVDFESIKKEVRAICDKLDEKILIPQNSPYLKIEASPHYKNHTEVRYNERVYCFPTGEIFFVPVANITSEALAKFVYTELRKTLPAKIKKIAVAIRETSGQSAIFTE
jgi:6-pyruvoyltetrahydropterin/6-carboxytetrahydropterin synthase